MTALGCESATDLPVGRAMTALGRRIIMPTFRYSDFVDQVEQRATFEPGVAARVIQATLRALAGQLPAIDIGLIADQLPAPMAAAWRAAEPSRATGAAALYAAVHLAIGGDPPRLTEQVQVIAQVLGEHLDLDGRLHLQRHLPESAAELVEPRSWQPLEPRDRSLVGPTSGQRRTLASGRPGSEHPITAAQADRAHRDSIARSPDPHAETKLSSGKPSVEDERAKVATGHPTHRAIADAHD
jgi:uncharacterized protein (DUF2267 family)